MPQNELLDSDLAALAKRVRKKARKTRAQAARDMGVSQTSIFHAEETPSRGLTELRIRMIHAYSQLQVVGPVFLIKQK